MKKTILLLLLVLALGQVVIAKENGDGASNYSIMLNGTYGFMLNNLPSSSGVTNSIGGLGLALNVLPSKDSSSALGLEVGLMPAFETKATAGNVEVKVGITVMSMLVVIKANLSDGDSHLFVLAGTGAAIETAYFTVTVGNSVINISSGKLAFGAMIGGGFEFPINKSNSLLIGVKVYNFSATNNILLNGFAGVCIGL